jgi:hypothetical protein
MVVVVGARVILSKLRVESWKKLSYYLQTAGKVFQQQKTQASLVPTLQQYTCALSLLKNCSQCRHPPEGELSRALYLAWMEYSSSSSSTGSSAEIDTAALHRFRTTANHFCGSIPSDDSTLLDSSGIVVDELNDRGDIMYSYLVREMAADRRVLGC